MIKYLPIPVVFFGLMLLNYVVIGFMNIDVNALIKSEIAEKGKNIFFLENIVPFAFALGGMFFWVKYVHRQSLRSFTTGRQKVDWKRVFFSFSIWSLFTIITTVIFYFSSDGTMVLNFKLVPFLILLLISVIFIPLQTSFEEYLFRGYLMQGIGIISGRKWIPLFITSMLFGLVHIANPEVERMGPVILIYYIGTGFFLGIITLMDDGLELSLGFHAANNLITALLITSDWSAFQTDSILKDMSLPTAGFDVIAPVFIIFPILLFTFSKKYKWSGWKEKLTGKIVLPQPQNNQID
ncbi:CPBP family intramembrane glutamic endopeptidase [Flavobacterium sp. 3HN19-14]|uniref:CPBP family intramembrane glutamic endopeptidase n=1 Tax=Flavobacterium sp. 3HN19-14 TaxID=3448133 RepID=UPI003EE381BB